MKWILGIDLRPRSRGAVEFARWLAVNAPGEEFAAVHVLAADHMRAVLQYHHHEEIVDGAQDAARAAIAGEWASGGSPPVHVVEETNAEDGLQAARVRLGGEALLIGRAAPAEGLHLVRLGRVARRLLRTLASPVAVAPPEFTAAAAGDGPIVALTSLNDDSVEACRAAAALAARTRRQLAVVHAAFDPEPHVGIHYPRSTIEGMKARALTAARAEVEQWLRASRVATASATVLEGEVVAASLSFAEERRAPVLFVGARQLSPLQRVFAASRGGELAATSRVPVVIVPATPAE